MWRRKTSSTNTTGRLRLALADLERIHNHYHGPHLGNDVHLNFTDPSLRDIPAETFQNFLAVTDLRVHQTGGGRRIILRTIGDRAFKLTLLRRINQFLKDAGVIRLGGEAFVRSVIVLKEN